MPPKGLFAIVVIFRNTDKSNILRLLHPDKNEFEMCVMWVMGGKAIMVCNPVHLAIKQLPMSPTRPSSGDKSIT